MNKKQQRRVQVLSALSEGTIAKSDAERLLGLSRRQVNRALKAYEKKGMKSVVHGNTGNIPANKTDQQTVERIKELAGPEGKYYGFNTCHLADMLKDHEDILIGRSTLDRIICPKKTSGRKTSKIIRRRRQRSSAEGMMLQIDGSPHDWLEGRGPKMCLVGAVDDATGKIVYIRFRPTEDSVGYLMMMRHIAINYGLPQSFYHDRHTILRSPQEQTIEDELAGRQPMSQLQRIMDELGVESIAAHSPQAKGRIERLWGVLQDRLVKEMRLAGISNIDDANAFLPGFIDSYNRRFAVDADDPDPAWVKVEGDIDINYYFSIRESRVVRSDHTLSWFSRMLQIKRDSKDKSLSGKRISVHTTPEGDIYLYDGKQLLEYKQIEQSKAQPDVAPRQKASRQTRKQPDPESLAKRRAWLFAPDRMEVH